MVGAADLQHLAVARSVLQDLQLEPCAAGQPLASELGWFDQCSWLLFNPNCSVGLWQICNVATLPGASSSPSQFQQPPQCPCSRRRGPGSRTSCRSPYLSCISPLTPGILVLSSKTCSWIFVQIQLGREWPDLFCRTQLECCNLVR